MALAMVSILLSLLAASSALGALDPVVKNGAELFKSAHDFNKAVRNKFIVEVHANAESAKRSSHSSVYSSLRKRGVGFNVEKEFDVQDLFSGFVVDLNNADDMIQVTNTPGVVAIYPVRRYSRPIPKDHRLISGTDDPNLPPDTLSTHVMTGVDKLHAEGVLGKGVTVGIIDGGVDYTHPSLGAGFGPGHKIIGGYDFVGDDYGDNDPRPDDDPLDQCAGHGTHVAGILGANPGNIYNISGVAPESSIRAYRIFGCLGSTSNEVFLDALLRAAQDGNNVITMSLGSSEGWSADPLSIVADRVAASGIIVTISAGNDGADGSWYSSTPANAPNAISIASVENVVAPAINATVEGVDHAPIPYMSLTAFPVNGSRPIYATSNDTTIVDDACNPLPDDTPDLSPYVVIIRRGTCALLQKLANVEAKGAQVSLIYNNVDGLGAFDSANYTSAMIRAEDGAFLVSQFLTGAPMTLSFPATEVINIPDDTRGGLMSLFSTYGPSNDVYFKPAIAAPGGKIVSTWPVPLGSFSIDSGTSMSAPFMAGVSALLLEKKGLITDVAKGARAVFQSTANRIPSSKADEGPFETLTQTGAGLVDAYKALHSEVVISPTELLTNDSAHFKGSHTFTVKNTGDKEKTFQLTHIPAGTALTYEAESIFASVGPVPLAAEVATLTIVPNTITVAPGQTQEVQVTIVPPTGLNEKQLPVFSGFIALANVQESYQVSYLGVGAALKDRQILDDTDTFFGFGLPAVVDVDGNPITGPANYTFVGDDFPTVLVRFAFGTPAFRVDLVRPDVQVATTIGSHVGGQAAGRRDAAADGGLFANVPIVGRVFSADYLPRSTSAPDLSGFTQVSLETPTFVNGTAIPSGMYRLLVRALKATGDAANEEDYESWLSPVIGVQPGA